MAEGVNRSNCLFYALVEFWKHRKDPDNYIAIRRCREHKWCLHWLHYRKGKLTQYTGLEGSTPPGWFGKILYKGRVKVGDE